MPPTYNRQALHELLSAAFDNNGLTTLAFLVLPDVHSDFSSTMTSRAKIELILDGALRHGRIPDLLAYIQRENSYQFQQFAPHLQQPMPPTQPTPPTMPDFRAQRLADILRHLAREQELLNEYREQLQDEDDPRRIARIKREIARQREAIAGYESEAAELGAASHQPAPPAADHVAQEVQKSLTDLDRKVDGLSQQIAQAEKRLTEANHQNREAIIAHIDGRHQESIRQLVNKLDENQTQLVRQLGELADQHKISREEADALARLTQNAVAELSQRSQNQPQAAEWQKILAILEEPATWEQKLKLTLPIIPGILAYESEMSADTFTALPQMANNLKQAWAKLTAKLRRDTAQ